MGRHGRGGVWGVYTPPKTSIPPVKTGWGYGNFFHVVKNFSDEPATFFCFARRRRNFWELGVYIPQRKKTCPCLIQPVYFSRPSRFVFSDCGSFHSNRLPQGGFLPGGASNLRLHWVQLLFFTHFYFLIFRMLLELFVDSLVLCLYIFIGP
jgi:hypothetical protein